MNNNPIDPPKPHRWKPGESGNPSGRPRTKPLTDEYKRRLNGDGSTLAADLIDVAIKNAKKGDFRYWQELMNRSDGKVMEILDVTTDGQCLNDFAGLEPEDLANLAKMRGGPGEDE